MSLETLFYEVISPRRKFYHVPMYLFLRIVSIFYTWLQQARVGLYAAGVFKTRRLGVPVLSVGNLVLGGTGKTPTVIFIADWLRSQGFKPAILSRGYGGEAQGEINIVSDGHSLHMTPDEAGDEPVMMARHLKSVPVLTGKRRYKTGAFAVSDLGADVLILDDGYQHLALHRDLNLLLCDSRRPLGNGQVFPAGELREPPDQLRRADVVVLTRCGPEDPAAFDANGIPMVRTRLAARDLVHWDDGHESPLHGLAGRDVAVFCGIGQPEDFFRTLERHGARIVSRNLFPDHYEYDVEEFRAIEAQARAAGAEWIVATEKDAVKIDSHSFELPFFVMRVELEVLEGRDAFLALLQDRLGTPRPPRNGPA